MASGAKPSIEARYDLTKESAPPSPETAAAWIASLALAMTAPRSSRPKAGSAHNALKQAEGR
jgi:hypothetical protein